MLISMRLSFISVSVRSASRIIVQSKDQDTISGLFFMVSCVRDVTTLDSFQLTREIHMGATRTFLHLSSLDLGAGNQEATGYENRSDAQDPLPLFVSAAGA